MGGQRRSELVEQERSYKLVTKEKKESGKLVKQTLRFLFSQVGLIVLGIFTATFVEFTQDYLHYCGISYCNSGVLSMYCY